MASLHDKNNPQTIRPILHTDFFLTFSTVLKTDRLPNPLTDISLTKSHPYSVCYTYVHHWHYCSRCRVYQQQLEPFRSSFNCWPFNFLTRQPQQSLFCLGRSFYIYIYKKLHYFYSSKTVRKQQDETPISFHFWIITAKHLRWRSNRVAKRTFVYRCQWRAHTFFNVFKVKTILIATFLGTV